MERQRNKPVKYNRELVHKSVKAMQKVEEVCKALTSYITTLIYVTRIHNYHYLKHFAYVLCHLLHAHLMECCTTRTCCSKFSVVSMQVRVARHDRFHEARMKRAAKQQNRADQKELETGIDLIEAPVARLHREQQAQAEADVQPMAVEQAEPVKEKVQAKEKAVKQKLRIPVEKPKKRVTAMES